MVVWKKIKDFNYLISSTGKVYSLYTHKLLSVFENKGYLKVGLYKDGIHYLKMLHVLLAEAFIPNPHNLPFVNHKDENGLNANLDNLEWCTHQYNMTYGTKQERFIEHKSKKVYQFDLEGNLVGEYKNAIECEKLGFNPQHIRGCCRGERHTHKGFKWSYQIH